MNNFLVSVIIPVYNAEKTIERCVRSILNQNYDNIELLLINDGSTDNSKRICEALAEKDKRIIFFSQDNQGVSIARNTGLKRSSGDYITFVDADDYILPDYLSCLVKYMEEGIDVVCSIPKVYIAESNKCVTDENEHKVVYCEFCDDFSKYMQHERCSVIGNLYRHKTLKDIWFNKEFHVGEDMLFHLQAIKKSKTIVYAYTYKYIYMVYPQSAFHGKFDGKKITEIDAYKRMIEEFQKYPQIQKELYRRYYIVLLRLQRTMVMSDSCRGNEYDYLKKEIKEYWPRILVSRTSIKDKMIWLINTLEPRIYKRILERKRKS